MKTIWTIVLLVCALVAWGICGAEYALPGDGDDKPVYQQCPRTKMTEGCLGCHVKGSFKVRRFSHQELYDFPTTDMKLIDLGSDGEITEHTKGYLLVNTIAAYEIERVFRFLTENNINHIVLEMHSPGGSLFEAQRVCGLVDEWRAGGGITTTKVAGFALSGGFHIFIAGDVGRRYVSPSAELMWHEIQLASFGVNISSVADKEEEARVLRHLQDTRNDWIASRSQGKMTKEELDGLIRNREWWITGKEAIEYGFADHLWGKE